MDAHIKERMKEIGGKDVLFDVPMSQYTTLRIGGNVEALYKARDINGLKIFGYGAWKQSPCERWGVEGCCDYTGRISCCY